MNAFEIYLIMQLDSIAIATVVPTIIGIILLVIWTIVYADSNDGLDGIMETSYKKILIGVVILSVLATILPNTKTAITMIAAPSIINNENVKVLPSKILKLIDKKIDEALGNENN